MAPAPGRPRPSWPAAVLACAAIAFGGCGGDGTSSDKATGTATATATATPTATPPPSAGEPGGSGRFRREARLRCREARRTVRLPRTAPRDSRLKRYVRRARRRDRALLDAVSGVRPPDDQIAAQVQALRGAYATLVPLYDRVLVADGRFTLSKLRNGIRSSERTVSKVAASMGIAACGPSVP